MNRIEIYGMNTFERKFGPFETYMIYFRPMSLTKFQKIHNIISKLDTIDISPKITYSDITAFINKIQADIISFNKVLEYARGKYIYGYLVQIKKPTNTTEKITEYDKISIIIHSKETNEYGMGECFVKKDFN